MKLFSNELRSLCFQDHSQQAPFVTRTRFERCMYGLLIEVTAGVDGKNPESLSEVAILQFFEKQRPRADEDRKLALSIAKIFEKFTYLCDTSNWSNDGQDPRIEICRDDILRLCDAVDIYKSGKKSAATCIR